MFGLKASAAALDGSALALTRAAAALGGAAVVEDLPGGKGKGPSWLMAGGTWAAAAGGIWSLLSPGKKYEEAPNFKWGPDDLLRKLLGTDGSPQTPDPQASPDTWAALAMDEARRAREAGVPASTGTLPGKMADDLDVGRTPVAEPPQSPLGVATNPSEAAVGQAVTTAPSVTPTSAPLPAAIPVKERPTFPGKMTDDQNVGLLPAVPTVDTSAIDQAKEQTRAAGQEIQGNLSVTAKPIVDTSAIDTAIAKARTLLGLLSNVASASERASKSVNAEMRRNFADGGGGGAW
jgi:hypothetical protein